ncbi:FAS1-like dehydratase domain-containing protein [Actinomadura roseirufa]|uniref:FAS1-like dehydratase domain-containing protein n=1 Tax=Actinomadura roseirufa TaxID=2094049 RepID=UPI00104100E7|nr:MaoC family dehydratase N-terminal domain-containing protein [Actinomadura roseirufa]
MYDFTPEAGKIAEFARATGSANPAYTGDDAVVPPTFLTTAFLIAQPPGEFGIDDLGFDLKRLLHGEEEYVFHGPPPAAGTRLSVTSRPGPVSEKEGRRGGRMRFAAIVHEYRDETGRLRVEHRTTLIETEEKP